MADRVFEILLHAETSTRFGARGRWYLADANTDRRVAERIFTELCERYPQAGIAIAIVLSELNRETGLYHDRVVQSRGGVPLIRRAEVRRLTEEARREIARAHAPEAAAKDIDLGRSQAGAVPSSGSPWPWIAAACLGMAVFAAFRGGF
ncbi:hypothetical protein [Elioraea sp.]|uniref:hypothetical protein n=1 Tax=Elioraea sp. TaxID=2185103 RepID=UPI003F7011E1